MGEILHQIGIRGPVLLMQLVGFLIVFAILKTLLFDRVSRFMAARAQEEERERQELAAERKAFAEAEEKLQARLAEIEKQAYEVTQAEVRAGVKRKTDIVSEAHEHARADVERARAAVEADRGAALARIEKDVVDLAVYVAGRAMDRKLEEPRYAEIARRAVAGRATS